MRAVALLALLVACGDSDDVDVHFGVLSLDVYTDDNSVWLYTSGSELPCDCKETSWRFPEPGECIIDNDLVGECGSCGAGLRGMSCMDAAVRTTPGFDHTATFVGLHEFSRPSQGEAFLAVHGCSQEDQAIPLPSDRPPSTVITTSPHADSVDVGWLPTARYGYVTIAWGTVVTRCLVEGNNVHVGYPFTLPLTEPFWFRVRVTPLEEPTTFTMPNGEARVWSGGPEVESLVWACLGDDLACGFDDRN